VHVTAQVAKAVIENFYGQPPAYSYFNGCSDGGREALMAAQRYPNDFDGIAAGAPANNMAVQNTYHHANRILTNQANPGYIPLPARNTYLLLQGNLPYVHAKVVAACDALDGVSDGIIDDPRNCKFDTNTLVCGNNGNEAGCLTQAQADAVFRIHDGAKTVNGVRLEPEIATEWGSELDWTLYMPAAQGGSAMAENFVNGWLYKTFINEPYKDAATKTPRTINDLDWTVPGFHATVLSSLLYSATNPDLRPFARSGGKLILWHGWADQHISPQGTIQYWERMTQVSGRTDGFARFYLFPGMGHCGSGLGPNTFDVLTPLMSWVETDSAPDALVANNGTTGVSRPVYPYPTVARYKGTGSTSDAANFGPYTPQKKSDVKTNNAGDYLYAPGFPQAQCTAAGTGILCDTGKKY
jgi:feruloyl esterase